MISVIICTYNRCQSLAVVLDSIARMDVPPELPWELIVVDNNSKDNTRTVVADFIRASALANVRYIFEPQPGLSYARNRGIEEARGEIIAFTDDDVTVDKAWLQGVQAAFNQFDCAAIAGRVVPVWPGPKPVWFAESGPFATPKAIVAFEHGDVAHPITRDLCGANMAFRRFVFDKYGLFRTDLGRTENILMGGEDIEFVLRIKNAGQVVLYMPSAIVFHPVSEERMQRSYFQDWCFNGARSQVRLEGFPNNAVFYGGVPRYLFRDLVESALKWIFSLEPKRRFYYKLQVYIVAGTILEARAVRGTVRPSVEARVE
jgi:glucosyl-dolichyl phosphate glucuronosyltransferase